MKEKSCEACTFWKVGDHSAKDIGNVGLCTFMLVQTKGFYDRNKKVPYWAAQLVHQTTSWDGGPCPTFKASKSNKQEQPA